MRFFQKFFKTTSIIAFILSCGVMCTIITYDIIIPQSYNVITEKDIPHIGNGYITTNYDSNDIPKEIDIKLLNLIPIKTTNINVIENPSCIAGGTPFGIKLFTKGVMVIKTENVETENGVINPAKLAGISKGDIILSINGQEITSNEQVEFIMQNSQGKDIEIIFDRNSENIKTLLTPYKSKIDDKYKCGMWVRDSSAGIGTITYYFKETLDFAGLGHGITDHDTGKIMPLNRGEVCNVIINDYSKGKAGIPGELKGSFTGLAPCGILYNNNNSGIFGRLNNKPNNFEPIKIRLKQQVKKGPAKMICTIDKNGPKEYDIIIDKIDLNPKTLTKNMTITITDPILLEKTGGIIQGMSGSPIIQDGELVGAVTHVFVNNPEKGYGIFIENMLENRVS
ncbi:MAG: SpoIVB peptidase [Oscillospiraceae bacterium]